MPCPAPRSAAVRACEGVQAERRPPRGRARDTEEARRTRGQPVARALLPQAQRGWQTLPGRGGLTLSMRTSRSAIFRI